MVLSLVAALSGVFLAHKKVTERRMILGGSAHLQRSPNGEHTASSSLNLQLAQWDATDASLVVGGLAAVGTPLQLGLSNLQIAVVSVRMGRLVSE